MRRITRSVGMVLLSFCSLGAIHAQQAVSATSRSATLAKLLKEYDRSINVMEIGLRQSWTPDDFVRKGLVVCTVPSQLPRTPWDEQMPLNVSVHRALDQCRLQRISLIAYQQALQSELK